MVASTRRSWQVKRCGGRSGRAGLLAVGVLAACWLLTMVWSGPAASAAATGQSSRPAPVKYYIVPQAGRGPANLFEIAAQTLGNGGRFMQIFKLNKGRLQPNGGRLEDPRIIEPGWVLRLPKDANGPGVHVGPLPRPTPSASVSPPSRAPSHPSGHLSAAVLDATVATLALLVAGTLGVLRVRQARSRRGRRDRDRRVGSRSRERQHVDLPMLLDERPGGPDAIDQADWFGQSDAGWPRDWPADHPSRPQPAVDHHGWPPAPGRSAGSAPPLPVRTPGLAGPRPRPSGSALVPRHARTWPPLPAMAPGPATEPREPKSATADDAARRARHRRQSGGR